MILANTHRRGRTLLALAATLALGACGADDEPAQTTAPAVTGAATEGSGAAAPMITSAADEPAADPASDEEAITTSLETVLTSSDPRAVCEKLVTERYVADAYGDLAGCRRAQADVKRARSARVSRVVVSPGSATAQAAVVPDGGLYAGDRLRAELILDAGTWKLDSLRSNVPVGP